LNARNDDSIIEDSAMNWMIRFTVEDTGVGIKEEDQAKLFKVFG
jgi:signal transduction histidine kinase